MYSDNSTRQPDWAADASIIASKRKHWGTKDRDSATAYVSQRLGSQVGQQLTNLDPVGYQAALFQLTNDPTSRSALNVNSQDG